MAKRGRKPNKPIEFVDTDDGTVMVNLSKRVVWATKGLAKYFDEGSSQGYFWPYEIVFTEELGRTTDNVDLYRYKIIDWRGGPIQLDRDKTREG